jgi:hypothetical protein
MINWPEVERAVRVLEDPFAALVEITGLFILLKGTNCSADSLPPPLRSVGIQNTLT